MRRIRTQLVYLPTELSVLCTSVNFWLFSVSMSFCLWASAGGSFFAVEGFRTSSWDPHVPLELCVQLGSVHLQSVWFAVLSKLAGCCPHTSTKCIQLCPPSSTAFIHDSLGFTSPLRLVLSSWSRCPSPSIGLKTVASFTLFHHSVLFYQKYAMHLNALKITL